MSRKIPRLLLILFFVMQSISGYSTHIFGGELLYTYISGNSYKVTLTMYGDCGALPSTFNSLYTATPLIYIFNNASFFDTIRLAPDVVGLEVSPVCPKQINNTSCNGGTLPGVRKFTYSNTVTLSGSSSKWQFIFSGEMGPTGFVGAGRSSNITNILDPGTSLMQLEADLNNLTRPNSSPRYSTIPTPFYCMNVTEQYNHGAIDADGDSLAFNLVPGIVANGSGSPLTSPPVTYLAGYSASFPLSTSAGSFRFNSLNGQMTFIADKLQQSLVVCQVSEYRNGVMVGTSEREMTFVVLDNCQGTPPDLAIANLSSGTITSKTVVNICVGTPQLSFNLDMSNPDGDSTLVTAQNLPSTAALDISNNNSASPLITFDWTTASIPTGIYTFYLTVKNNHCPISNTQTIAYTINVAPVPTLSATLLFPTQCVHQAAVRYDLAYGFLPRKISVVKNDVVIKSYIDTTGTIIDSLYPGTYTVIASSDSLCTVSTSFNIIDSGTLPLPSLDESLCIDAPALPIILQPAGSSAVITWYGADNIVLTSAPVPNTSVPGTYTWYVVEQYKVCISNRERVQAVVHGAPIAQIINVPKVTCLGDTLYLTATGGVQYTWSPRDQVIASETGQLYTRIVAPVTLSVSIVDQYGCTDSTSVTLSDVQPCCSFYYPTAFTPNGDGKNDGFRIVSYGNTMHYRLTIFNRWGQIVFDSVDPRQYWDGKQHGVPCEVGTYFYYFKGQCLTGKNEEYKGDVTLIR